MITNIFSMWPSLINYIHNNYSQFITNTRKQLEKIHSYLWTLTLQCRNSHSGSKTHYISPDKHSVTTKIYTAVIQFSIYQTIHTYKSKEILLCK